MKKTQTDNSVAYYIEDANIYTMWKLAQPELYAPKHFYLSSISPIRSGTEQVLPLIKRHFDAAGAELKNIGIYYGTESKRYPPKDEDLAKLSKDKQALVLKAFKVLNEGKGGLADVDALELAYYGVSGEIYFLPRIDEQMSKAIFAYIDKYIELFLNRELYVYDRNYWIFEKQKEYLVEKLRKARSLEKFGSNFIVSEQISLKSNKFSNQEFLFIHTLYTLQKLGYIKVIRLWHVSDTSSYEDVFTYNANIIALDPFIEEINSNYRKDNPALVFEKYDDKKTTIYFAGKVIEISKKNKESDAVALIRVLVKELDKDKERYWYEDEVAEFTGNDPDDIKGKHKYYYAARNINDAVQIATGVDDFIDATTKKYRINPKYLKI